MSRLVYVRQKNKSEKRSTHKNSVRWVQSGTVYFEELIRLIHTAKFEIHLQTYIFASDNTGKAVADALLQAAARKVEIFILVDAYGSQNLSDELISKFKNSGINFRKFGRFFSNGRFHLGRRLHHKITTIDNHTAIVGGLNISDNYNQMPDKPAWLDYAVIVHGNASRRILYLCRRKWTGWQFSKTARKSLLKIDLRQTEFKGNSTVFMRENDFIRNKSEITISYRNAFRYANNTILIVGGYFLPGGRTRRIMRKAIERGVKIDIVVSEKSDVAIVTLALRYLYDWMMRNGIGVYEYLPSNVHGKVIITDQKWTSIGSYDLNNLSTYSNIELNLDIHDSDFSASLALQIREIMSADCEKVTSSNPYRRTTILSKLNMWISYRLVKTFFFLSLVFAGKKEREN